ncbi:MAG: chitobiase/beta-hexosaminidase C-terminal domain-containing protein [Acidobacteriota bacterium]
MLNLVPLRRQVCSLAFVLLFATVPVWAADFYVSPTGRAQGAGSIQDPWDLKTALAHPAVVKPGDSIWLRGGTYVGMFTSVLKGNASSPIIVRQYPGERATLDAATPNAQIGTNVHTLNVQGEYTWYWGFEVTNSNPMRATGTVYNNFRGDGLWVTAPNTKFINLIVHDTDQGFSYWEAASNSEVYGSVIYNNGWSDPLRGRGHNIYAQNRYGSRWITDNVIFQGFDHGVQIYGSDNAYLDNFVLEGNIAAGNPARNYLIGGQGSRPALNPVLKNNYSYYPVTRLGGNWDGSNGSNLGYSAGCSNPVVTGNYFGFGGLRFVTCSNITLTGNTFYGVTDFVGSSGGVGPTNFPNNQFLGRTRPTANKVFVRPNRYEPGRAHLAIFNWELRNTVDVDISGIGLNPGDAYELHNGENYYGDVVTSVWDGGSLAVRMTGHTTANPLGYTAWENTYPEFGVFIIQKAAGSAVLPAATPLISPAGGGFSVAMNVTITTSTPGAQIRYTTDGSFPGSSSTLYSGPLSISQTTTLRARAFKSGLTDSSVATADFTRAKATAPGITPAGGTFSSATSVSLSSSTPGASIFFTLDGSAPTGASTPYTAALSVSANTTLRAVATAPGLDDSPVSSATFIIASQPTNPGPPQGSGVGQALITSVSSSVTRNNFNGWLGLRLTVGVNPLPVVSLGRLCAPGNTRTHGVKLVSVQTGADVQGGVVSLNMAGCAPGQFVFAALSSPLTLPARASYYLASAESMGGDLWYEYAPVTATPVATVSAAYATSGWYPAPNPTNASYVPVNLLYSDSSGSTPPPTTPTPPATTPPPPATTPPPTTPLPPPPTTGTPLLTSFSGSVLRNNFTGWLGMLINVGPSPLSVITLGRLCASGNSSFHTVKLVNAQTGADVPGGSVSLGMTGCTAGQFWYGSLTSPLTLPAGGRYYLASYEAIGGDMFYDYAPVTTTSVASVSAAYATSGWFPAPNPTNAAYVPVNLTYAVTAPAPPVGGTPLVSSYSGNLARNNFTGWLGMRITVGPNPFTVTSLGRLCSAGNAGVHAVKLVDAQTGADVPGGTVSLSLAGCTPGQFSYSPLSSALLLPSQKSYYLASYESAGGDRWLDYASVTILPVGTVSAAYSFSGSNWFVHNVNNSYVPVNLLLR